MLDESMFEDIHEIAENSAYLKAVEERDVCTEMFDSLPVYSDCRDVERKLEADGLLAFEQIFHEPTGFYMLKCFLISDYAVDKAIFIKDVEAYKSMRFESARKRIAALLFQRFVSTEPEHSNLFPKGSSVFEILDRQEERKNEPNINNLLSPTNLLNHGHALNNLLSEKSLGSGSGLSSHHNNNGLSQSGGAATTVNTQAGPDGPVENSLLIGKFNNTIGVYGKSVRLVKEKIEAGQAPKELFDDVAREVLTDLRLDAFPRFRHSTFFQRYIRTKWIETQKVAVKDFTTFRVLGRGGFGAVHACRKKNSGMIYAMKAINKKLVKVKSALDNVLEERNVLVLMKSNFVTNIKYALQDEETLYLVMDLMLGGDLKFHLINAGRFNEKRAKFYAAQVLLGLEHVHRLGIIYRDMKLENVLLDEAGHVKLSDLGLAVVTKCKIKGYAGCLEENEKIRLFNGKIMRVGDLDENQPSSWPLLMTETGEKQEIEKVYRGTARQLYEITDSVGSYKVTFTHRLSFIWRGPSARGFSRSLDYNIQYFTVENNQIVERQLSLPYYNKSTGEKLSRDAAELLAWREFSALGCAAIEDGAPVMVTVKNFLKLGKSIRKNLSEHTINNTGNQQQQNLQENLLEESVLSSALSCYSSSLAGPSDRLSVFLFKAIAAPAFPSAVRFRPLRAADGASALLLLPSPSSPLSAEAFAATDAERLAFFIGRLERFEEIPMAIAFLSPVVGDGPESTSWLENAQAIIKLAASLGIRRFLSLDSSVAAAVRHVSVAVSRRLSDSPAGPVPVEVLSISGSEFELFCPEKPERPSDWPLAFSALAKTVGAPAKLPAPFASLCPNAAAPRPLSVRRVEREDQSKFYWVGVEVKDSRHRVVLESGSVTGNTPGYTAPEMIKNKLYGPSADIFSYGVMLYRMLCGSKPFKGKIDRDLDKAVLEKKPQFPKELFSKEATALLTGLLQKRPENRLGCGERGIEEIKEHAFFESIDWGLLESGYIEPPFVPNKFDVNAASLKDIGDFDRAKYRNVKLDERFKQRIKNFEYTSAKALADEMALVLAKVDENVNFEKFAVQPKAAQPRAPTQRNGCCLIV